MDSSHDDYDYGDPTVDLGDGFCADEDGRMHGSEDEAEEESAEDVEMDTE